MKDDSYAIQNTQNQNQNFLIENTAVHRNYILSVIDWINKNAKYKVQARGREETKLVINFVLYSTQIDCF